MLSSLFFCRELCTELPGYMKQNECGDVIMCCQQEQVRRSSVQPLSVSHLGWVWRCSVCPQAPLRCQSASAAPQDEPDISMKGCSAQRERENIKLFCVEGWGLLFVIASLPFLFALAVSLWKNWTVVFFWWVTESLSGSSFLFLICGLEFWKSLVYLKGSGRKSAGTNWSNCTDAVLHFWVYLRRAGFREMKTACLSFSDLKLECQVPSQYEKWKSFISIEQSWLPSVLWSWLFSSLYLFHCSC